MKILIINNAELNAIPPVRNLVDVLLDLGHSIVLVSRDKDNAMKVYNANGVKTYLLRGNPDNIFGKVLAVFQRRRQIRRIIEKEIQNCDLLWAASDRSALDVGMKYLKKYRCIVQLLELAEDIPMYNGQSFVMANLKKYAKLARKIVVPEYNRAHILQTWWDLKETPVILPNKPYKLPPSNTPDEVKNQLIKLINEKRKVVLYQGDFNPDRDLESVADALEPMENYVLYLLGRPNNYLDKLLHKKPTIEYLGYIQPPYHICAARYADLGLLPYKPTKSMREHSELNALYCAPNKIYEYASQGLPMIGPDIPGLKFPFELYGVGECYQGNERSIMQAIYKVESNIDEYKANCLKFWELDNIADIVYSIISDNKYEDNAE